MTETIKNDDSTNRHSHLITNIEVSICQENINGVGNGTSLLRHIRFIQVTRDKSFNTQLQESTMNIIPTRQFLSTQLFKYISPCYYIIFLLNPAVSSQEGRHEAEWPELYMEVCDLYPCMRRYALFLSTILSFHVAPLDSCNKLASYSGGMLQF